MLFEVNGKYANRIGQYTVLSVGPTKMKVRYDDGTEAELSISIQERIWENIVAEREAASTSRAYQRKGLQGRFFIKTIEAITNGDLIPPTIRTLVGPCSQNAPQFKVGDRFLYFAINCKSFFAVATVTGEAQTVSSKEYAELNFKDDTVLVYPLDLDAFAINLSQAVWLDSVELESQPNFRAILTERELYLELSEDDFELVAEMLTEFVEEIDDESEALDEEEEEDIILDDDLDV